MRILDDGAGLPGSKANLPVLGLIATLSVDKGKQPFVTNGKEVEVTDVGHHFFSK